MKIFKIDKNQEIVCDWKKTRNGFKHIATLVIDDRQRESAEINYLNRTWERYDYESVLRELLEKTGFFEKSKIEKYLDSWAKKDEERVGRQFGLIGAIAMMGEIFGKDKKEKNDWKERMIGVGLGDNGLIIPNDWGALSEDEKERRLNNVIQELKK